ncbi:hypothetical protein Tco_0035870 [Tanacetum coccineum]
MGVLHVPSFLPTDDPLEYLNKDLAFMCTTFASSYPSNNTQLETFKAVYSIKEDTGETINYGPGAFTVITNALFQSDGINLYDSDCVELPNAQASFMANLSSWDSDILSEVPYSNTYLNDMINQDVQEMLYSEQTHIVDFPDNETHSDSNIIPYS